MKSYVKLIRVLKHSREFAGYRNYIFTMDYIVRLNFKLLFRVHSSKFGKCLLKGHFPCLHRLNANNGWEKLGTGQNQFLLVR